MEQRVSLITLGVADLQRSREFYEHLGWRRSMIQAEGVVFFQAGGMALALYPRDELAKDANIAPDGRGFSGMALAYNTRHREEVDSVLAQAQAAGANLLKPPQTSSGSLLGRLFGIFFRSGRLFVGGSLEPVLSDRGRWKHSTSRLECGFARQ